MYLYLLISVEITNKSSKFLAMGGVFQSCAKVYEIFGTQGIFQFTFLFSNCSFYVLTALGQSFEHHPPSRRIRSIRLQGECRVRLRDSGFRVSDETHPLSSKGFLRNNVCYRFCQHVVQKRVDDTPELVICLDIAGNKLQPPKRRNYID